MNVAWRLVNVLVRPGSTYSMLSKDQPPLASGLLLLTVFALGYTGVVLIGVFAASLSAEKVRLWAVLVLATRLMAASFSPEKPSLSKLATLTCFAFVASQLVLLAVDYLIVTWLAIAREGLTAFVNSLPGALVVGLYQPATAVWLLYQHSASVQALYKTSRPTALAIALASMAPLVGGFLLAPYLNIVI